MQYVEVSMTDNFEFILELRNYKIDEIIRLIEMKIEII